MMNFGGHSLRDSVDSSDDKYEMRDGDEMYDVMAPADDPASCPTPVPTPAAAVTVYDPEKRTDVAFVYGSDAWRSTGDKLYAVARAMLPRDEDSAACGKAVGMILDAFTRQGPAGVCELLAIAQCSDDGHRAREEIRRCLAIIETQQREYDGALCSRLRQAVRARHPKGADRIATEIAAAALGAGNNTLRMLVTPGNEAELDGWIARTVAALPPGSLNGVSSPVLAPVSPGSMSSSPPRQLHLR